MMLQAAGGNIAVHQASEESGADDGESGQQASEAGGAQAIAAAGVAGASDKMPHGDRLQEAFGGHSIEGAKSRVGGEAKEAANSIGADAYVADGVAGFAENPDLGQAAHEGAHLIHQRAGKGPAGGVSDPGDVYEQNADAVAEAVMEGKSAEPLLDEVVGPASQNSGAGSAAGAGVQKEAAGGAAATTATVKLRVGGSSVSVKLPTDGSKKQLTISPSANLGELALGALSGKLKKIKSGASGRLKGSATYRGHTLRVSGRVKGKRLKLTARYSGDAQLAPGLSMKSLRLKVGKSVSGSGKATITVAGVNGRVSLGWKGGKLTGTGKGTAKLPILGRVKLRARYGPGGFDLDASAPDIHPARLAQASIKVITASLRAVNGQLAGNATLGFADKLELVTGNLTCAVSGTDVSTSGTVRSALGEASGAVEGTLTLAADGTGSVPLPAIPINIAGVVTGSVDLNWSSAGGAKLSNAQIKAKLPWGGEAEVTDIGLQGRKLSGKARIPLPEPQGLTYDGDAAIQATLANGALNGSLGPLGWTSTTVPGLTGTTHLTYDAAAGLSGRGTATMPVGSGQLSLTFDEISWQAGMGLTGVATVAADQFQLDWMTGATVSGQLQLRLQNGDLVGTNAKATATLPFGTVELGLEGFDAVGPKLALAASITNLGDTVSLAAPILVNGRHEQGATSLLVNQTTFDVSMAAGLMTLSGTLGQTTLDATGLSSSVLLELHAGPLGLASASAEVLQNKIQRAEFQFATGTFRYPFDSPVVEGTFSGGGFSYDNGQFAGHVSGDVHMVGQEAKDGEERGGLHFNAKAGADGALSLMIDGGGFHLGLIRVDRFMVSVQGEAITSDIQLAAREDLPFTLTGGVAGSFSDAGLVAQGNLQVGSKEDSPIETEGAISVAYTPGTGLTAGGVGTIGYKTADEKFTAKAGVSFNYDGTRLMTGGMGTIKMDQEAFKLHLPMFNALGLLFKKLEPKFVYQVGGLYGVRLVGKFSMAHPDFAAQVKGGSLSMLVPQFDLLGDKPPSAKVNAMLDANISAGLGITPSLEFQVYLLFLTAGLRAAGTLALAMSATSVVATGETTFDPEKGLTGGLNIGIPLALTLTPSLKLSATAGLGTWTVNVKTIAEEISDPVVLTDLPPVTTRVSWGAMSGDPTDTGSLIGEAGVGPQQLASGLFDGSPKIKAVIRKIIAAANFFTDIATEVDAITRRGGEFWGGLMAGDDLETAQRDMEVVERLTRDAPEQARVIQSRAAVLTDLARNGVQDASPGHIKSMQKMARQLMRDVLSLRIDLQTLNGQYGADIPKDKIAKLLEAERRLTSFQSECIKALANGA